MGEGGGENGGGEGGGEKIYRYIFLVILQLVPHFTEILLWYNFSASKNMAS